MAIFARCALNKVRFSPICMVYTPVRYLSLFSMAIELTRKDKNHDMQAVSLGFRVVFVEH